MKTKILIAAAVSCLAILGQPYADDNDLSRDQVPKPVLDAFEKAHPNARDVEFEAKSFEGNPAYEIEFKENGKEYEFLYKPDGSVARQKEEDDND
jgi:uncharacterized membrane protein YkoI